VQLYPNRSPYHGGQRSSEAADARVQFHQPFRASRLRIASAPASIVLAGKKPGKLRPVRGGKSWATALTALSGGRILHRAASHSTWERRDVRMGIDPRAAPDMAPVSLGRIPAAHFTIGQSGRILLLARPGDCRLHARQR
jgi:hypothetical protein